MKKKKSWLAAALSIAMMAGSVPAGAAASPAVSVTSKTVYVNGEAYKLKVKNAKGYAVTYSSGNSKIARVSKTGSITGVRAGRTNVKVLMKKNGKTIKKNVVVTVKTGIKTITIGNRKEIKKGVGINQRIRMETTAAPKKNDDTILYRSSDETVATVSDDGIIQTVGTGTAVITAKAGKSGKKATVTVTVKDAALKAEQTGARTFTVTSESPLTVEQARETISVGNQWEEMELQENGEDTTGTVGQPELDVKVSTASGQVASSYTVSEDGKTVVVKTGTAIRSTQYTITIAGSQAEVKGEAEEAKEFKIVGDKMYLTDISNGKANKAVAEYGLFNQFGERMTSRFNVSGNSSLGQLTVDRKYNRLVNELQANYVTVGTKVQVNIYTDDMQSASAELTLVAQPHITRLEYKGLYQPEGKELTTSYTGADDYYILLSAKDQYGNEMNDPEDTNFQEQPIGQLIVNFVGGQTKLALASRTLEQLEVDGEKYLSLKLSLESGVREAEAGEATLTVMSPTGGETLQQSIPVAYGSTVDTFEVLDPVDGVVVAGEETEFHYRALDINGEPVENIRELKKVLVRSSQTGDFEFRKEEGEIKLFRKEKPGDTLGLKNAVFMTNTFKSTNCVYTVMAKARPTAIVGYTGLSSSLSLPAGNGSGSIRYETNKFQIADQYGRIMDNYDIYDDPEFASQYAITIAEDCKKNFLTSGDTIELKADQEWLITPRFANANKYLEFLLVDSAGNMLTDEIYDQYSSQKQYDVLSKNFSLDSACDILVRSINARKITRYEVEEIPDLYFSEGVINSGTQSPYASDVIVYGVLSDGYRVELSESSGDFSMNLPGDTSIDQNNAGGRSWLEFNSGLSKLYLDSELTVDDFVVDDRAVNSFKREIEIVPNNDAEHPITREITISRQALEVRSASLRELSEASDQLPVGKEILSLKVPVADLEKGTLDFIDNLNYTDQYGANNTSADKRSELDKSEIKNRIKYFISDVDSEKGYITSNGSLAPKYEDFAAGDTFMLRMVIDKAEISLWVNVI